MPNLADMVPISSIANLNAGLSSPSQETMIEYLGSPVMPLTTNDSPDRASAIVRKLEKFKKIGNVKANGIGPAVDSLEEILTKAFDAVPGLKTKLRGNGMLVVRLRRPTSGKPSKKISNHAWGTAIDFNLVGMESPGNTGKQVPYFIAALTPFLNAGGWYSGISFADDMHFEVATETIKKWKKEGKFG